MATVAELMARTLAEAGVTRMYGLPGGEILDFIDAARRAGIQFILTRDETTASFIADAEGFLTGRPAVCVSTLGPGAINMTLGVANAWLDRSPVIAVTASMATASAPYATHQQIDLNAVYRPFTKAALTLDGRDTLAAMREACRLSVAPRMGPVHVALPSDVARMDDPVTEAGPWSLAPAPPDAPASRALDEVIGAIRAARRPVLLLGLDLDPRAHRDAVRTLVDRLDVPVFATPKVKGLLPEDHPRFLGVCGGVAGDAAILDFFNRADVLLGVGYDPVESDKLWHRTNPIVSLGPISIAAGSYRPLLEVTGDLIRTIEAIVAHSPGPFEWTEDELSGFRRELEGRLRPQAIPVRGLSPWEVTRCLRDACPRETIATTDVGSVKFIVSQAWRSYEPLTFLESNGLSSMGYGLPAAIAAKLQFPGRPVVCTVGDGGLGMRMADIETCVRLRLPIVIVVFNDDGLSLIQVVQRKKGYADYGVGYGHVDFAAAAVALGARGCAIRTLEGLADAMKDALGADGPTVIDVAIDPSEYHIQTAKVGSPAPGNIHHGETA
ncbi:MAG TPA: thiamine pyrophosphate-binding protein [Vicinamibacterales bacterium]